MAKTKKTQQTTSNEPVEPPVEKVKNPPHRFAKGTSGNPAGRPKGAKGVKTLVQESLIKLLDQEIKDNQTKETAPFADVFLRRFMAAALHPGTKPSMFLAERLMQSDMLDKLDEMINKGRDKDLDFQQYRILKKGFDVQQRAIMSKYPIKMKCAGRRAGKTKSNILDSLYTSVIPGSRTQIIGLSFSTTVKMYWDDLLKEAESVDLRAIKQGRNEGYIEFDNGSIIQLGGNSSVVEREKCRGFFWDLVIVDEAQSHRELRTLIEDIITPTLLDRKGTLILSGSGPRIRGTYFEHLWNSDVKALRLNWNLADNPHIPDHETVLDKICEEKKIDRNSPLFKREYLGLMDAFDDDALVFRLNESNYYETDDEIRNWINSQPISDIYVTGGLDLGWTDSDGIVYLLLSDSRPEKFLIYEHKQNRQKLEDLTSQLQRGLERAKSFGRTTYIYCDHNEQRTTEMLSDTYGLPMMLALKTNKAMAIEFLQEEVRRGNLKVKKGGYFDQEALKTVWKRDQADNLTREIDDDSFHPDLIFAVIYALRDHWNWHPLDNLDTQKLISSEVETLGRR